jgi:S1-C subfamily serine protease
VTATDVVVIVWVVLSALVGYRRGLIAQALALVGFAAGAWVGSRIAPHALSTSARLTWQPVAALLGAVVGGAIAQAATSPLALMLRRRVARGPLATADGAGGLVAGAALGVGVAWLLAVTALHQPALGLRGDIQRSAILPRLVRWLPAQSLIDAIARFDSLPVLGAGGVASLPRPDPHVRVTPGVGRAEHSVVEIEGTSCGLTLQGSGWVIRPDLVATNAHVIAGEHDTRVLTPTDSLSARPVYVSGDHDIALLRVPGLNLQPLRTRSDFSSGTAAALLGYPEGGPLTAVAGRVGRPALKVTPDAYGHGVVPRNVVPIRGTIRHGDSGGPAVDRGGHVLAMMFAATVDGDGGFGVSIADIRHALASQARRVDTGPCVT